MTKEKQTFRKGYYEINRVLDIHYNEYCLSILHGFCQDDLMAASIKDCQMAAF